MLDIIYEFCEYSKQLLCWYADVGQNYNPTVYSAQQEKWACQPIVALDVFITSITSGMAVQRGIRVKEEIMTTLREEGDDDFDSNEGA